MIKRNKRPNPISKKRRTRSGKPGKLGIVRVYGKDAEARRNEIGERDGWICEACGIQCSQNGYDGRPRGEWAHRKGKRNHGDKPENGRILCGPTIGRVGCHQKEHNAGGKPCPPKPPREEAA